MHKVNGSVKGRSIEVCFGEGNEAWCTMVREEYEDLTFGAGLDDLSISTLDSCGITLEDSEKVLRCNVTSLVINVTTSVNINSTSLRRFVKESIWDWVRWVRCDIVIGQDDNVLLWNAILF